MSISDRGEEDFKLVCNKRRGNKKVQNHSADYPLININSSPCVSTDTAARRVQSAKEDLLSSDVYASFKASLREAFGILQNPNIKEIVCFGLGRFGECIISRYQLALLLCLKDLLGVNVSVFDPVFTSFEHLVLREFDCNILTENSEGKYPVKDTGTTIFFLPHCPKQLCNNLLWSNWGLQLSYCVIISNSFNLILESNSVRQLANSAEYILNISPYVEELAVINNFKFYDIFNDTAIHIFPPNKINLVSDDIWKSNKEPTYTESDAEFITKSVVSLRINSDSD